MAEQLIPYHNGIQYDGSNGAAIVAQSGTQAINEYSIHIVSESGGTLVLGHDDGAGPNEVTYETGDWAVWAYPWPIKYTDSFLNATHIKRSDLPS